MPAKRRTRSHAWYALRRTLPPWTFEENLAELIDVLPRYGVDEVIVKVDAETFSHGHPPLQWVQDYIPNLERLKEAMEGLGIVFSINPWFTIGHCDRGWEGTSVPGIKTLVGHDGSRCRECACPLSKTWRNHLLEVWRLYAGTGPHALWVEDDIRTFNHDPVRFGCFCPAHLRVFSRRVGTKVNREQVVAAVLKPGKPHPWRKAYLDMQGGIMAELMGQLARAVHAVDPDVCLGLMSSGHHYHSIEGRRWSEFAEALADGQTFYSRPPLGIYRESSLTEFYYNPDSIKGARHVLPEGTVEQAEVDNGFFSLYTASVACTFLKMATSFAYGCHGLTMNLFDHNGTPMEHDPAFGRLLQEKKPYFESLARVCQLPGRYRGVQLLHHPETSSWMHLPRHATYADLDPRQHAGMEQLEALGIATTYDDEKVAALSGQVVRALPEERIRELLQGGLLLDGSAAKALFDRGFGRDIGLRGIATPRSLFKEGPYGAEEFFHPDFGGADRCYVVTLFDPHDGPSFTVMDPMRGVTVVSRLVDPDGKRTLPTMLACANRMGGRVVIHGFDLGSAYGSGYCRPERVRQIQGAVDWISRGRVPLKVHIDGAWPLSFRKDCDGKTILGAFNLSLDPWPEITFDLASSRRPSSIQRLTPAGRWRACPGADVRLAKQRLRVRYAQPLPHDQPLFLLLHW